MDHLGVARDASRICYVRSGFKGEDYGKGRWTQTQLNRRQDQGKTKGELH